MKYVFFFVILSLSLFVCATSIGESDEVYLAVKHVSNDAVITQGRPGKQGVAGPIGPAGVKGDKGNAGSCTCDYSEVMELRQQIQQLRDQLLPDEGWFAPGNGHQYFVTSSKQTWQDSRRLCQSMGGDLATFGMRNYDTRLIIARALLRGVVTHGWIGLNDTTTEGSFVWVDGMTSTPENTHWAPGEPNNSGNNEDCALLLDSKPNYRLNDGSCLAFLSALCEKRLG